MQLRGASPHDIRIFGHFGHFGHLGHLGFGRMQQDALLHIGLGLSRQVQALRPLLGFVRLPPRLLKSAIGSTIASSPSRTLEQLIGRPPTRFRAVLAAR
jgi:hypothetical protein